MLECREGSDRGRELVSALKEPFVVFGGGGGGSDAEGGGEVERLEDGTEAFEGLRLVEDTPFAVPGRCGSTEAIVVLGPL